MQYARTSYDVREVYFSPPVPPFQGSLPPAERHNCRASVKVFFREETFCARTVKFSVVKIRLRDPRIAKRINGRILNTAVICQSCHVMCEKRFCGTSDLSYARRNVTVPPKRRSGPVTTHNPPPSQVSLLWSPSH